MGKVVVERWMGFVVGMRNRKKTRSNLLLPVEEEGEEQVVVEGERV